MAKTCAARVEMLASVTYNAKKKALYLTEPQLQQFILNGVPEQNVQLLSGLFMPAIEKLLKRKPLYRLKDLEGFKNIACHAGKGYTRARRLPGDSVRGVIRGAVSAGAATAAKLHTWPAQQLPGFFARAFGAVTSSRAGMAV